MYNNYPPPPQKKKKEGPIGYIIKCGAKFGIKLNWNKMELKHKANSVKFGPLVRDAGAPTREMNYCVKWFNSHSAITAQPCGLCYVIVCRSEW